MVPKDKIVFTEIGNLLGMDRRTVSRYTKRLLELGLLVQNNGGDYILKSLENNAATLVPYLTLR